METLHKEFIEQAIFRMDKSSRMVKIVLDSITEEEIWQRPNKASNSIGNLILHLCGNITQYAISSLGEMEDTRERDKEFSTESGFNKQELLDKLMETIENAKQAMVTASLELLMREREVQGFKMTGVGIIIHVVEHYSYHVGQIAFWTKQLKNKDLGFYDGIDLKTKNKAG